MQDLRSANKQRRRHQILLAAHDVIGRDGIEALTMRALADTAMVSVPTVYALVGGRDDVIDALMAEGVHRFDHGAAAIGSRGLSRVTAVIDLFTGIVDRERELVRGLLASGVLASLGADRFLLLHRVRDELERAFTEAVAEGELRTGTDPAEVATVLARLGLGAVVDWVVDLEEPEELRGDLVRSVAIVIAAFS